MDNMSQEKVNKYKEEKANRKANMRKDRMKSMVRRTILLVLSVALVGWVGFSAYDTWQNNRPRDMVTVNYESITDYLQTLADDVEVEPDVEDVEPEGEADSDVEDEVEPEDNVDSDDGDEPDEDEE
jgi:predicted negative regulator of RcsB-dependent stress response